MDAIKGVQIGAGATRFARIPSRPEAALFVGNCIDGRKRRLMCCGYQYVLRISIRPNAGMAW
jgi:hypothetical protein